MSGIIGNIGLSKSGTIDSFKHMLGISDATHADYEGLAVNIGKMRIVCGVTKTGTQNATGLHVNYSAQTPTIEFSGFKPFENTNPLDTASTTWGVAWGLVNGSHDTLTGGIVSMTGTGMSFVCSNPDRSGRVANAGVYYIVIGEAA